MADAWIYSRDAGRGADMAAEVAELGYAPRIVAANGSLRPLDDQGPAGRPPDLAVVIGDEAVCGRLRDDEVFADVPILLAMLPEDLNGGGVPMTEELVISPFTAAELEARIARARRQLGAEEEEGVVKVGSLEVDLATYQVTVAGEAIDFAFKEYELLRFFVTHPGRVFSREALLNRVWGYDYYGGARTVDVHVRRLRAKLGNEGAARIKTVRGVGYRFDR
ncbi:MAG TPA: winged helix-turn-helix domain-containing protein [Solirubrobacterales bacterium]|nr:winged helix-turn-helix domain-containing protein [Solirubrobacterales bacterium]